MNGTSSRKAKKKHRNKCNKQQEKVRRGIEQDCAAAQTQEEDESRGAEVGLISASDEIVEQVTIWRREEVADRRIGVAALGIDSTISRDCLKQSTVPGYGSNAE